MPGSWSPSHFPFLTPNNHSITSKATKQYNCIAWAASETNRRWDPDPLGIYYWPLATRSTKMEVVAQVYETIGFRLCFSTAVEDSKEKIAIYGETRNGVAYATH